jgi:hypothetical protein
MNRKESQQQRVVRVSQELGAALRSQIQGRYRQVRTAERNEPGRHVWRFQVGPNSGSRFLHVEHKAMSGTDATPRLLRQLEAARWIDRLKEGPETAFVLSADGELSSFSS